MLALASQFKWPVYHFDDESVFLNGEIQEEVYVEQPAGFVVEGDGDKVYRLKKAPRAWYSKIDANLMAQGFERSQNEHTLYKKVHGDNCVLLVCLYVDDIVYLSSSQALIDEFKHDMHNTFEMKDLGLLNYFLGLQVTQSTDGVFITQKKYNEDMLKQYGMHQCKSEMTPVNSNERLRYNDSTGSTDVKSYKSLVGKLLYLTHTRPEISFAVGLLSRFMSSPTKNNILELG